jgi:NADH dehydrogenase
MAEGLTVRAFVRDAARLGAARGNLEVATGLIEDEVAVEAACRDVDWVVHLAAAKSDEPDSEAVNVGGARNLVRGMEHNGVKSVINVSTQSAKLRRPGVYGRTKAAADQIFADSGLAATTLHVSLVYGDIPDGVFGMVVRFSSLPVIPMFGDGQARYWPIHRDDLATLIWQCVQKEAARGRTFDVGGPDEMTFDELIGAILTARGTRRRIVHIPVPVGLALAGGLRRLGKPLLTASNVLGGAENVPMNPTELFRATGFTPRPFEEGLAGLFVTT